MNRHATIRRLGLIAAHSILTFTTLPSLRAQASGQATGTSNLTIGVTQVIAYGDTQLSYASAATYNVSTTVALFQGSNTNSMSAIGQDHEQAPRASVPGTVTAPLSSTQIYKVETAHSLVLVYNSRTGYTDVDGFSLEPYQSLDSDPDDTDDTIDSGVDIIAPGTPVTRSSSEISLGDSYQFGAVPSTIFADPDMGNVMYNPVASGNDYQVTISSQAYSVLEEEGFLDAATVEEEMQACPFPDPRVCEVLVGGTVILEAARTLIDQGILQHLYNVFKQKVPGPIPYPGNDPNVGPPGWSEGTGSNGKPYYTNPKNPNQSVAPDVDNQAEGPHWDYNDRGRKPKSWRLWPDGTMSPK